MISILVADGQRMVREGLRNALDACSDLRVVAEAADGREVVRAASDASPDVVVLDAQLPLLSGIDALKRIRQQQPRARCVLISSQQTPARLREALLSGASAFVPKTASFRELVDAIRAVAAGRSYLALESAEDAIGAITSPLEGLAEDGSDLTIRQREVLQLIAEGLSTKEIAGELGVSLRTVESHRANLMQRTGIHKVSSLVRYAIREGIVAV